MDLTYKEYKEQYLDKMINSYMDYYNAKGGSWTYDRAYKRIHQIASMEDSVIILQFAKKEFTGFLMGYFKHFDDSVGFFLEEILVFSDFQGKGCGTAFLSHLKSELKKRDCSWIELLTTTGDQHQNFYSKNGYSKSSNLVLEYLDL